MTDVNATPDSIDVTERVRMESFAHLYTMGQPLTKALVQAGYSTTSRLLALRLLQNPHVQEVINTDREWLRKNIREDIDSILLKLDHDREFAYQQDNPSAAIAATMAMAKILNLPDASSAAPKRILIEWGGEEESTSDV